MKGINTIPAAAARSGRERRRSHIAAGHSTPSGSSAIRYGPKRATVASHHVSAVVPITSHAKSTKVK